MKNIVREVDLAQAFQTAWQLYKGNFGFILGTTLVAGLVGLLTFGICAGPMMCGLYGILLALLRNRYPRPRFAELFQEGFARFLPSVAVALCFYLGLLSANAVLGSIPIVGTLAGMVLPCAATGLVSWAQLMLIDQNSTLGEALTTPVLNFQDRRFWSFVLAGTLAGAIGFAGMILCFAGVVFTMPFAYCLVAAAYEQVTGGGGEWS